MKARLYFGNGMTAVIEVAGDINEMIKYVKATFTGDAVIDIEPIK